MNTREITYRFIAVYLQKCFICGCGEKATVTPFSSHIVEYAPNKQDIIAIHPAEEFDADGVFYFPGNGENIFIFTMRRYARRIDVNEGTFPKNFKKNTPNHQNLFGFMPVLGVFDDMCSAEREGEKFSHQHLEPPLPGSLEYDRRYSNRQGLRQEIFPLPVIQGDLSPLNPKLLPWQRPLRRFGNPYEVQLDHGTTLVDPNEPFFDGSYGETGRLIDPREKYEPPPEFNG